MKYSTTFFGALIFLSVGFLQACSEDKEQATALQPDSVAVIEAADAVKATEDVPWTGESDEADDGSIALRVLDISERSFDGGGALAVTFSTPLDTAKPHDQYFTVVKNEEVEGSWVLSDNGKIAYFSNTDPNAYYSVKVHKGLVAANGQKLSAAVKESVRTRNIKASVSFASQGSFLPLDIHSGLPVVSVNVPEIDIGFHRVKPNKVAKFLNQVNGHSRKSRYYMRYFEKYTDLLHTARYTLDSPANKRREFNLPVQDIEALKEPGLYMAVLQQPGRYYEQLEMTWFAVTDIGVHVRVYDDQYDAYFSSIKTAKPLSDVDVKIIESNGSLLASSNSSKQGFSSLSASNDKARYLLAEKEGSVTVLALKNAALDLSDFDLGNRPQLATELFVYSPRDLYRPGETTQFSALLRTGDGRLAKAVPLKAKIQRPDGQVVKEFSWQPEALAYYGYQYALPKDAQTGEWHLQVNNVDGSLVEYAFKVEEFMPERMKLAFNPEKKGKDNFVNAKQAIDITVLGEYLYGAPASGNRLSSVVSTSAQRTPFKHLKYYQFGNTKESDLKQLFNLDDVQLNADGLAQINISSRWQSIQSPMQVILHSSLYETGGRAINRLHRTTVWPKPAMVGIRPSFKDQSPKANSTVSFDIARVNAEGKKVNADKLEARLIREDRRYFWTYSENQGWHYEYSDREYAEFERSLDAKAGGDAKLSANVEWGWYRLEVRDPEYGTLSSVRFHAGENWYKNWERNNTAEQAARPDKVSLALDKKHYKAGETATLSMVPPTAGEAIVLVESNQPLFMQRIHLPKSGAKIKIPVDKTWKQHDLYISVVQIQGADERKGKENFTPKRAFGLIHLPLNRSDRQLQLSIDAAEKITPNQRYIAKVKIDNIKNKGDVRVTLAAVDVGVLSISDFKTPQPFDYFFEQRRYQVDSRDMYNQLIELNDNALARQKFGGDAELSRGGKLAQAEVQIVSIFSGVVNVNAEGVAEIPLDIPDFNGRVRLMAVAFGEDSFGSTEQDMTIAAPLVTQLSMPRFLAMGDQSTLALDVHNLTEEKQVLEVKLTATAPLEAKKPDESITLAAGEKKTLLYPVTANYQVGRSQIHLSITGIDGYPVIRDWGLHVRSAYPAITGVQSSWIKPDESFLFDESTFGDSLPESRVAVLSINNTVDLQLRDQMDALLRYPYGCLEQSTSSTYPWIFATKENLKQMGLENKTGKTRTQSIEKGMQRIAAKQLSNGGYGLWSNKDGEVQWLTAYVADFLTDARTQNIDVNATQFSNTMNRLKQYVNKRNGGMAHPWNEDDGHYALSYRAYAAYVLSRHRQAKLSQLRSLVKNDAQEAQSPLPLIHLALALSNQGDQQQADELFEKAFVMQRGDDYYGDYGSDVRDSALIVNLLIRHKQHMDEARRIGLKLADALQDRDYLSTQERNSVFLAGLAIEKAFSKTWQADVQLRSAVQTLQKKGSFSRMYEYVDLSNGIVVNNTSDDDLWVTVKHQSHGKQPPAAISSENLSIARDYYDVDGKPIDVAQLKVGQLIMVRLTLGTRRRTPDVMVVDLLPAGLELENQNLDHAIKLDDIRFNKKPIRHWRDRTKIVHKEYRDDRFVAAVDAGYEYTNYLFYLARAVTPGTYRVPSPFVEDMYRPEDYAIGETISQMTIGNP